MRTNVLAALITLVAVVLFVLWVWLIMITHGIAMLAPVIASALVLIFVSVRDTLKER